jgi:hypothetical protein
MTYTRFYRGFYLFIYFFDRVEEEKRLQLFKMGLDQLYNYLKWGFFFVVLFWFLSCWTVLGGCTWQSWKRNYSSGLVPGIFGE